MPRKIKERNRYIKIVEWSDEDQCYIGSVPGWIGKCCHGGNEEKVYRELCQIVDEWIGICAKDGRPLPPATTGKKYSGKFQLRLGSGLHQALAIRAMQTGDSLNNFCKKSLKKSLSESDNFP